MRARVYTNRTAERDFGGHFACMECPNEMVGDMREFFGEHYDA
jgi:hypothetical protein